MAVNPKPPGSPGPAPKLPHEHFADKGRAVQQASTIGASGKPSVTRSALGGAGAGAATGAAVGTAFGGVGAAPGAVIGAGLGAAGGAVKAHGAKKLARKARIAKLGGGRQLLVGEFLVCMVILALSPLTDKHKDEAAQAFIKRAAAMCAVFFVLGLIGSAGRGPTKVASGLGALITLSLLVSDRDIFAAIATKVGASDQASEPSGLAAGNAIADIANNDITTDQDIAGQGGGG
jgi:hypothetical protein